MNNSPQCEFCSNKVIYNFQFGVLGMVEYCSKCEPAFNRGREVGKAEAKIKTVKTLVDIGADKAIIDQVAK